MYYFIIYNLLFQNKDCERINIIFFINDLRLLDWKKLSFSDTIDCKWNEIGRLLDESPIYL